MSEGPAGALTGYAWVWGPRGPEPDYDGHLIPSPRRAPGAVEALLSRMEARVLASAAEGSLLGARTLAVPCASTNASKRAILQQCGYARVRTYFRMERELDPEPPPPDWPPEFEAHRMRLGLDDADVHSTLQEAFADHYRFMAEPLEEWAQRAFKHEHFAPDLSFVARHRGAAAAAVTNYSLPAMGWIGMLGVRRAWRRRGLASAFLLQSFAAFRERGYRSVGLGVDSENADDAPRLYERLGMQVTRRDELFQKTLG